MVTKLASDCQMLVKGKTNPDFVRNNRSAYETYRRAIRISAPSFIPMRIAFEGWPSIFVNLQDVDLERETVGPSSVSAPAPKYLEDIRRHIEE